MAEGEPRLDDLNALLEQTGERPRSDTLWRRALGRSIWHLRVETSEGRLVGFVRATSDRALNANLWDLWADRNDPAQADLILALVQAALNRLRRELPGCSISLSAPPETLAPLERCGFVVNPGGIRAMGLML
ncbi:MAG: N-acetyltransferase [Cyanobium sp.]|nr:N-acetyltransferase [Cyanobium sp.]